MGLGLTLMLIEHDEGKYGYSHSLINCESDSTLFEEILKLKSHPVPETFNTFRSRDGEDQNTQYGDTQTTPYGEPLEWVYVKDLLAFKEHAEVRDSFQNRAAWAYLAELPPKFKIALYWH